MGDRIEFRVFGLLPAQHADGATIELDAKKILIIAYGCPSHSFNNFSLDCFYYPIIKDVFKNSVFVVNTVNKKVILFMSIFKESRSRSKILYLGVLQ
jgi:hypothetical protein